MFDFPIELLVIVGFIGGSLLIAYGVVLLNKRGYKKWAFRLGFFVPGFLVVFLSLFEFLIERNSVLPFNELTALKVAYESMRYFVLLLLGGISGASFARYLELNKSA